MAETPEEAKARRTAEREAAFAAGGGGAGGPRGPGSPGKELPTFLSEGLVTSMGHPGARLSATTLTQICGGVTNENIDQTLMRQAAQTWADIMPGPDRVPMPPERFWRTLTLFWMKPIPWIDTKTVGRVVKKTVGGREVEELEEVKILQPGNFRSLPPGRRWTVWAVGGPYHPLLYEESRLHVFIGPFREGERPEDYPEIFPFWYPRDDHNFAGMASPWYPTSLDYYQAVNKELASLSLAQIDALCESGEIRKIAPNFSQWAFMNQVEQKSWTSYACLMVALHCRDHPANCDPFGIQYDPHLNEHHGILADPIRDMVLGSTGRPIYKKASDTGSYYEPVHVEAPEDLTDEQRAAFEKERFGPLFSSDKEAYELGKKVKGWFKLIFDPCCTNYYDMWGNPWPVRVPELGIISDVERVMEQMYPVPGSWLKPKPEPGNEKRTAFVALARWLFSALLRRPKDVDKDDKDPLPEEGPFSLWSGGPRLSLVGLLAELNAEGLVLIGKLERALKLASHIERLWLTGEIDFDALEKDVSSWYGTHVPKAAKIILDDARFFLDYFRFWLNFTDLQHGHFRGFQTSSMKFDDLCKLVRQSPEPTDLRVRIKLMQWPGFDPEASFWGKDPDGTPRLPTSLIFRLSLPPELGGLNMLGPEGQTVLTNYRNKIGEAAIREFWNALDDTSWSMLVIRYGQAYLNVGLDPLTMGLDYLTMGYVFWRPMEEPEDFLNGFLHALWWSQPLRPFEQRLDQAVAEAKTNHKWDIPSVIEEAAKGFPCGIHGRDDVEKAICTRRADGAEWQLRRYAELYFVHWARVANPGDLFKEGGLWRTGDDAAAWHMYQQMGLRALLCRTGDVRAGRGEERDLNPATGLGEYDFQNSSLRSRALTYWAISREKISDAKRNGYTMLYRRLEIADWLVAWSGLPDPTKKEWQDQNRVRGVTMTLADKILGNPVGTAKPADWAPIAAYMDTTLHCTPLQIERARYAWAPIHNIPLD